MCRDSSYTISTNRRGKKKKLIKKSLSTRLLKIDGSNSILSNHNRVVSTTTIKPTKDTDTKRSVTVKVKQSNRPHSISITRSLRDARKDVTSPVVVKDAFESNVVVYGTDSYVLKDVESLLIKLSYTKEVGPALKQALTTYAPELDKEKIILPVENIYQHDKLKLIHPYIVKRLRIGLNNKNVIFETRVVEEKESKKLYYTDKEKLEYMIEKNPKILKLIQTFGLELK